MSSLSCRDLRRWEDEAFRVAYRVTGEHDVAEDVRQTVFLRLMKSPRAVRHAERLAAWLRRSVVNEAINAVRRRKRRR